MQNFWFKDKENDFLKSFHLFPHCQSSDPFHHMQDTEATYNAFWYVVVDISLVVPSFFPAPFLPPSCPPPPLSYPSISLYTAVQTVQYKRTLLLWLKIFTIGPLHTFHTPLEAKDLAGVSIHCWTKSFLLPVVFQRELQLYSKWCIYTLNIVL